MSESDPSAGVYNLVPRGYQVEAVDALFGYWSKNAGNPVIVAPTGSGKSVILGLFCRRALDLFPSTRILIATHVKELVEQDHAALSRCSVEAGIYSAGVGRRDTTPVLVGSIQSLYRRIRTIDPYDLLLIDECHLCPDKGMGMYRRLIDAMRAMNPRLKVAGFTATPFRLGSGLLTDGDIFDDIAYEITIPSLLTAGHLAPLTTRAGRKKLDLGTIRVRSGEYRADDIEAALAAGSVTDAALDEVVSRGAGRRSWLVFCPTVAHAEECRDKLRERGITAEAVHGGTPREERARVLEAFKRSELRAVTNCQVLTTGFDAPMVDMLVMLRPTKSCGLYVQMCGRGMRVAAGKQDCLVLDFARLVETHGPVDKIRVKRRSKRNGGGCEVSTQPCRECPQCGALVSIRTAECADCGFQFPCAPSHDARASDLDILSKPVRVEVSRVSYSRHEKNGRTSLRAAYFSGISIVASEFICFEHAGYPRLKACAWWAEHGGDRLRVPRTVVEAEAQTSILRTPKAVIIDESGRYPTVVGREF